MSSIVDTLRQNIASSAEGKTLTLAENTFSGLFEEILTDYLEGITIPLGSAASLTVKPADKTLVVTAHIEGADLEVEGTPDSAKVTVTATGGSMSGASIVLEFTRSGSGVAMSLDATMGDSLTWQLGDLWPSLFDWSPAKELALAKGELKLETGEAIDFTGSGSVLYSGTTIANGVVRVLRKDSTTGVLLGAVVTSWSPGTIWPPLKVLTFQSSGLIASTLPETKSGSIVGLGLIPGGQVPALDGDYEIKPGVSFFSSLELKGPIATIGAFFGTSTMNLFASYARSDGSLDLQAELKADLTAYGREIFKFDGVTLDWKDPGREGGTITATAKGSFYPNPSQPIDISFSGSVVPSEGDLEVSLSLSNWVHPFGIETLTIEQATASLVAGAQAEGITVVFGGEIKLQNPNKPQDEFELGLAAEIADFETPTGVAFWMDAQYEEMDLADAISAAFAVDVSPTHLRQEGEPELADMVQVIDDLIKIKSFTFWCVEGASLQKIGDHGPFAPGFGLQSEFELFSQEDVAVSVVLAEKGANPGYSGSVDFKQTIKWGSVLEISGWDPTNKQKLDRGPLLAISATKGGKVVQGINGGKPVYFYVDAHMSLLDLISGGLYGLITPEGLFQFTMAVRVGTSVGGAGAWGGDSVTLAVDPHKFAFTAGFQFDFGWHDIHWPTITLWGIPLIPAGKLPDFDVSTGLSLSATAQTLLVKGWFDFDFMDLSLSWGTSSVPETLIDVDLSKGISSIGALASELLSKLGDIVGDLIEAILDDVGKFLAWIGKQLDKFVDAAVAVAKILAKQFGKVGKEIFDALKDLGVGAAAILEIMIDDLGYAAEEVEQWLSDTFGCPVTRASNMLV